MLKTTCIAAALIVAVAGSVVPVMGGTMVADAIALVGSIDIVLPEVDR